MKEKQVEEQKEGFIKIKFLGNYKEFINGEEYELKEEEALPYLVIGYAKKVQ